jgi:triacylglycerol lipase
MDTAPIYQPVAADPASDCVVLLHGLGRTSLSMALLAHDFKARGFVTVNQGYRSRSAEMPEHAKQAAKAIAHCVQKRPDGRVHFVTHSMGAIVLRQFFADIATPNEAQSAASFGRAVLLGPPNHGSEIIDAWGKQAWFRFALGPAGMSLGTDAQALPQQLPSLPIPFAVIAGNGAPVGKRMFGILPGIPTANDGKVSVQSTQLEGMQAFQAVSVGHTFLPLNRSVRRQVMHYLLHGTF